MDIHVKRAVIYSHLFPSKRQWHTWQVTLQQAALPGTYDFVQAVLGAEQAQDEADMLDDFIQQGAMHQARARGEEDEEEVSSMEELEAGGEEDVYEEEEEEAFLEAQLQDERCATLRWLRRLKGHVVQYPADFLCEDLPALKPLNGLEGLVL